MFKTLYTNNAYFIITINIVSIQIYYLYIITKSCKTAGIASQESVDKACEGIKIAIKVGKENVTYSTVNNINNHILRKNNYETIIVTISYEENALVAEGDFNVSFGDIALKYSVVD